MEQALNRSRMLLIGIALIVLSFLSIPVSHVHAESADTTKVIIHYVPLEGDPTNWSIWAWGEGGEGARYPFTATDENGVKTAQFEIPGRYEKVGFVVSTEDWIKDGGDQFITIVNGSGEAQVIGGGIPTTEGSGNMPMLWLITGIVLAIIYVTIMEQLRRRRSVTA